MLEGLLAGAIVLVIFVFLILIAWLVFYLIGMYKFYEKAGQAGWKAIIPYYNSYVLMVDMGGLKWYWFAIAIGGSLLSGIPYVGIILSLASTLAYINSYYNLSKKLNKSTGWFILTIFFSGFTLPILGYSKDTTWNQAAPVEADGFMASVFKANSGNQAANQSEQSNTDNAQK